MGACLPDFRLVPMRSARVHVRVCSCRCVSAEGIEEHYVILPRLWFSHLRICPTSAGTNLIIFTTATE